MHPPGAVEASPEAVAAPAPDNLIAIGTPLPLRRTELVAWLEAGLRDGRAGRLEAEYPTALDPAQIGDHTVARVGGALAAHALGRLVRVRWAGRDIPVGLIGLVYTDPAYRGRGLARACIEACLRRLAERGAMVAALWSDLESFYTRLGVTRGGVEWIHQLEPAAIRAAARAAGGGPITVAEPQPQDWCHLEGLYDARPVRAVRSPGDLQRLGAAPECDVVAGWRDGVAVAYAARGRGDDFRGVVHEWAGEPAGVLACFEALAGAEPLTVLSQAADEPPLEVLSAVGTAREPRPLAWLRLLDAERLWDTVTRGEERMSDVRVRTETGGYALEGARGSARLAAGDLLSLLFGPRRPEGLAEVLSAGQYLGLRRALPWPLYFWGFDSI